MTGPREPLEVLADVPGWGDAELSKLDGGLTNRTWLVQKGERKAVLKVDNVVRGEPFNSRQDEARIQSNAAGQGLANGVLYVDAQALMTEYAEGSVWQAGCFAQDGNIELVASALRRLHALPLTGRSFNPTFAASGYVSSIEAPDADLVEHCMWVIDRLYLPRNLCCCHNDLVATNILTTPEVKFLDWEYACDNDPLFDLATIVEHHELDEEAAFHLLDAYFDGDGKRWRKKLIEQQELYRALHWLWLASRPATTQGQLDVVAARIER